MRQDLLQAGVGLLNEASDIRGFRQSGVPGPGLHHHAGVHLEQEEPQRSHELLRAAEFPGTFSPLGSDGLLPPAGQLHHRGPSGYRAAALAAELFSVLPCCHDEKLLFSSLSRDCGWPRVLLSGGRLSQPAGWRKVVKDPVDHVSRTHVYCF